ncbi:MAG TPA: serine hydrolase domain-containing protein [Bryobacteraceae bacterium]|nr:serine hydrolase domain-containing protein [Bryobacteraceae bacterium]
MTKLQFRVLYREFLFRIVDLELLAPQGDMTKLLGQFAALLLVISLWIFLPTLLLAVSFSQPEIGLLFTWAWEFYLIATAMLVVGLFAVLSWESMFPDRRDVLVLAPLPIRARTLFWSKIAAVATALGLAVLLLNFFPGIAAPFALAAAPTAPPPRYDPAIPPVSAEEIQTVLDRDLTPALHGENGALAPGTHAGLSIGVLKHGVRRVFSYGIAQPDWLFEIGSITKTFTGLVLAQMVVEGKVRLDEPVRELLPAGTVAKPQGTEITLLDLITHHSGLPRMPDNFAPADADNPYADYHVANLYAYVAAHGVTKRGTRPFLYSNLGVGLLGQALANRAGMRWADLVKTEITGPLGMRDTVVSVTPEQNRRFIQGFDGLHHPAHAWDIDGLAGAGALRSTAGDMLTYLDAELHPENAGPLAAAIRGSQVLHADANPGTRIALAWVYEPDAGYGHGGATGGYTSSAFFDPKRDDAAVVLFNTEELTGFAGRLGEHIRQRLAGQPAMSLGNIVVSGSGSLMSHLRAFTAYWVTMLAAGAFIFCSVLTVQGLAQLLPRQLYLRASSVLQMVLFCLLWAAYFWMNPFTAIETLAADQERLLWLPPLWFLALFQKLSGPVVAQLDVPARRAWIGLAAAAGGAAAAYLICYFRTLRKMVEQPDIVPAARRFNWLPRFGNSLETAVGQFSARTLVRSRQHRVILAFYLGIGTAIALFIMRTPEGRQLSAATANDPWHQPSAPLIASSILLLAAWVGGIRMVFSMPLELRANWVFRVTPVGGGRECLAARRRALYALSVVPFWTASALVFFWLWPWRPAAGHLIVLALLGITIAEICLNDAPKIPFTCSYLPGKTNFHLAFWACLAFSLFALFEAADWERGALANATGSIALVAALAIAAALARWRTGRQASSDEGALRFEEAPEPVVFELGLDQLTPHAPRALPGTTFHPPG